MVLTRPIGAAIDANAPVQDDADGNGPIDSDEEKDAVMAGLARSLPQPLVTHTLVPMRRKYHLIRVKDMLSQAFPGTRGGLFSSYDGGIQGGNLFKSDSNDVASSDASVTEATGNPSAPQQPSQNRSAQGATSKKTPAT